MLLLYLFRYQGVIRSIDFFGDILILITNKSGSAESNFGVDGSMVVNEGKRILSFLLMNHLNSFRHLTRSSSKKIQDCPSHFVLINDATDIRNQVSSYGHRKSTLSWTSTPSDGSRWLELVSSFTYIEV